MNTRIVNTGTIQTETTGIKWITKAAHTGAFQLQKTSVEEGNYDDDGIQYLFTKLMVNIVDTLAEAVSALTDTPSEITAESLTSAALTEAVILSSANTIEATIEPLVPVATGSSRVPQPFVATS
ncbi:unnamed protein product, partial [Didymodactylos carnosus]